MPAVLHTNSVLQGGMVVTSESVSEQANGLVNVQMEFVYRASNSNRLGKLFYNDAPPPIFPESVQASELLSRKLYMISRSVSRTNGFAYVQAEYAGGYASKRNNVLIYTDRESEQTAGFQTEPFTITRVNPDTGTTAVAGNLINAASYSWIPLVKHYEYVEVGNTAAYSPVAPQLSELYSLTAFSSSIWVPAPELGWSGIKTISYEREWFINQLAFFGVKQDRRPNYITPTVKIIQHRYYI
jgi:hypothetical protein